MSSSLITRGRRGVSDTTSAASASAPQSWDLVKVCEAAPREPSALALPSPSPLPPLPLPPPLPPLPLPQLPATACDPTLLPLLPSRGGPSAETTVPFPLETTAEGRSDPLFLPGELPSTTLVEPPAAPVLPGT